MCSCMNVVPRRATSTGPRTVSTWVMPGPYRYVIPGGRYACPDSWRRRMDFGYDARTEELREQLLSFMASHVYPAENASADQRAPATPAGPHWAPPPALDPL